MLAEGVARGSLASAYPRARLPPERRILTTQDATERNPTTGAKPVLAALAPALRTVLVLLLAWQGAVWLFQPPRYILPSPLDVALAFQRQPGFLFSHSLTTIAEMALGFVLGSAFGALTALAIVALPRLGRLIWPILLVLQAFPVFVIAPLLVVWFGFGIGSKVIMATIIIFFPVASAYHDGLTQDRLIDDLTRAGFTDARPHGVSGIYLRGLHGASLAERLRLLAPTRFAVSVRRPQAR